MGYMRHHAIVVTYWDTKKLTEIHAAVRAIDPFTSDISPEAVNGYRSFFVPPDGSKEGWDASSDGDGRRARIKAYLKSLHDDDTAWPAWVEVQFGDDNLESIVADDSDAARREKALAEDKPEPKQAASAEGSQNPPDPSKGGKERA